MTGEIIIILTSGRNPVVIIVHLFIVVIIIVIEVRQIVDNGTGDDGFAEVEARWHRDNKEVIVLTQTGVIFIGETLQRLYIHVICNKLIYD